MFRKLIVFIFTLAPPQISRMLQQVQMPMVFALFPILTEAPVILLTRTSLIQTLDARRRGGVVTVTLFTFAAIRKNGKELEANLAAQNVKYGMFPFLRLASLYDAYYRKIDLKQEKMGNAVKVDKPASVSILPDDSAKRGKLKMAAQQAEPWRSLSVKPLDSRISGLGSNAANEREGSSLPSEAETKQADGDNSQRRSKRSYRSRSEIDEDDGMGEDEAYVDRSMDEVTEDSKTKKKHSRHSRDNHKHESSSDDEYPSRSRHRHKHRKPSDRHELHNSSDNEREHHNKDVDYSKDKRSHHHRSKHVKYLDSADDEPHHDHRHRFIE
ncbi:hypothetical protein Bca101_010780 [Brassica carinata]